MAKSNAKYGQFFVLFRIFLPSLYTISEAETRDGWALPIWYFIDIFTSKSTLDKRCRDLATGIYVQMQFTLYIKKLVGEIDVVFPMHMYTLEVSKHSKVIMNRAGERGGSGAYWLPFLQPR